MNMNFCVRDREKENVKYKEAVYQKQGGMTVPALFWNNEQTRATGGQGMWQEDAAEEDDADKGGQGQMANEQVHSSVEYELYFS